MTVGDLRYERPRLVWSTPQLDLALAGHMKKLKCIYSGLSVERL